MPEWLRFPWLPGLLLAGVGFFMARLTWRTWADPIIDFGRELYVLWRLVEGQRLYAEIAYHNGPLSPHLNGTWFGLAGVAVDTLLVANGLVLALVCWLIFRLLARISSRATATLGCTTFLVLFAFGQYLYGNHNWLCPYSHELTHGIALSLLSLWALSAWTRGGRPATLGAVPPACERSRAPSRGGWTDSRGCRSPTWRGCSRWRRRMTGRQLLDASPAVASGVVSQEYREAAVPPALAYVREGLLRPVGARRRERLQAPVDGGMELLVAGAALHLPRRNSMAASAAPPLWVARPVAVCARHGFTTTRSSAGGSGPAPSADDRRR